MSIELRQPVGAARAVKHHSLRTRALPQVGLIAAGDVASGFLAHLLVNLLLVPLGYASIDWRVTGAWLLLWLFWRAYQGLYPGYGQSPQTELRSHTVSTVQVAVAQMAAALAVQRYALNGLEVVLVWLVVLVVALPVRYGVRSLLISLHYFGRPVSIIGAGQTASMIIDHLLRHPSYGLNPVVAYDDNSRLHGTLIHGVLVAGSIDEAISQPRTEQAVIGIPSARAETQRLLINSIYSVFPITWSVPDLIGVPNQAMQPHNIGALASLEIRNNLRSFRSRLVKRSIDLAATLVGGILILPVFALIALAIRLDSPGPVVYRARRLGKDGESFDCFKFRSMHQDADEKLRHLLDTSPLLRREYEDTHKLKSDPRVTRVGAFLRKTSLDELPQLLNVLLGTMSLVGPRPIVEAEVIKYGGVYAVYKQVRPGITGYWQANGRSDTTYEERVGMDNFYITNWTPWLDLVILLQTVRVVLAGKGAY
ncbi:undecaprenyl-phosphate galactose phosphotransferase WbaP [Deinococcus sonorensis]|uniref:Undecaprenyl-phosphate galactose phosphotransferase WbaP n=2 Tax=Deinococcus sonorensis TaxID=309891 RepID=A0AAU7UEX1_9DEIO